MSDEAYTVVFWRAEDNSHCMVNRQIHLAHAHFKNSWSGYPILMFENHAMINPSTRKFSKSLHKPLIKDFAFFVPLFLVSLPLSYQMIKERYESVFYSILCHDLLLTRERFLCDMFGGLEKGRLVR